MTVMPIDRVSGRDKFAVVVQGALPIIHQVISS